MAEQVVIVSNFDSGLKYADRLAAAVEAAGAVPVLAAPTTGTGAHLLGDRQIEQATARTVEFATWDEIVGRALEADAVVPVSDGPRIQSFIRDVHRRGEGGRLPVFGAGYIGLALSDFEGGYLMRSLADVIAVNSRSDLARFEAVARAFDLPETSLVLCGLPLLPATPAPQQEGPIRTVLFADQPTVPGPMRERAYVWERLARYAERHPDREVLLRPRHAPGEDTFHRMRFSPDTWATGRALPPNFRVDHRPIHELLQRTDLLLTVSSTAALESVAAGVRTAFVADFVNDACLNPTLLPSGLMRRFDDIDEDRIGTPDPAWIDSLFPGRSAEEPSAPPARSAEEPSAPPARSAEGATPAGRFAARLLAVARGEAPRSHEAAWNSPFHVGRRDTDERVAELGSLHAAVAQLRFTPRRVAAGVLRRALRVVEH